MRPDFSVRHSPRETKRNGVETRIAPANIAIQSELRYHQHASTGVHNRQVHLAGLVLEDAEAEDLFDKVIGIRLSVGVSNSEKY